MNVVEDVNREEKLDNREEAKINGREIELEYEKITPAPNSKYLMFI